MTPLTPSEVRLGNLTSHGVVVLIENERFVTRQEDLRYSASNCVNILPVPLTPEILEGFGFEKSGNWGVLKLDFISTNGNEYEIEHNGKEINLHSEDRYEHVYLGEIHAHTLQNLVQAISGVELVYKPNKAK